MENILANDYAIKIKEKITIDGKEGYKDAEYIYFTIPVRNKEIIHMEQAALAYYLAENGYPHTACPIQNVNGKWFTVSGEDTYITVKVKQFQGKSLRIHGKQLADFHQANASYLYEPEAVSSYGQWKQLWINKLNVFENRVIQEAQKRKNNHYYQLLMDILPYIIGISENAIQYMQETLEDDRYLEVDQGTITFRRYHNNLIRPVIWSDDLVYDHPVRDVAEFVRKRLFTHDEQQRTEIVSFLNDYQTVRPLSIFSWRLLYARLLFPIPIFDLLEKGFYLQRDSEHAEELTDLLEKQEIYEQNLASFFQIVGVSHEALQIPVLHWL